MERMQMADTADMAALLDRDDTEAHRPGDNGGEIGAQATHPQAQDAGAEEAGVRAGKGEAGNRAGNGLAREASPATKARRSYWYRNVRKPTAVEPLGYREYAHSQAMKDQIARCAEFRAIPSLYD